MNKIKAMFKNRISFGVKIVPFLIVSIIVVGVNVAYAQSKLTPPERVTNTMYSLTDIYNLANGTGTTEGAGDVEATPGTVEEIQATPRTIEETGKTLTEVYDKVAEALQSIPPTLTWQTDPALTLCWSNNQYEIGNGCTVGSGFIQTPDTNTNLGAVEYCQYLATDGMTLANTAQNIWHLPTIQEYTSITDYSRFNSATTVTGFAEGTNYWSSTEVAESPNDAWYWVTYYGNTGYIDKVNQNAVRCAH